jgi:hypothetical protein
MSGRSAFLWLPVLISLCATAICFEISQSIIDQKRNYTAESPIKLNLPGCEKNLLYSEDFVLRQIAFKKVTHYFLPGNSSDTLRITTILQDALKLHFQCDSTKVIRIQFGSEATFGNVYNLVRFLRKHSFRRYCLIEDNFYIFGTTADCDMEKEKLNSGDTIQPIYL